MMDGDLVSLGLKDSCFSSQARKQFQLKEWSMVVIRDSSIHGDYSVFPPIDHENLRISSQPCQEQQNPLSPSSSSSSSSSFSSSSSSPSDSTDSGPPSPPPSDSRVKNAGEVTRWIGIGLEVLRCKVSAAVSSFRRYDASTKGALWSFGPVAAAVVLWMLFVRVRRRRRRRQTESMDRLKQVIKEKDEKITQLLHQIAQMNQVLLARHRDLT